MSQYDTIRYETDDGLLRLTLNRPDHMNAFTVAMADELEDAYRRANGDDAVKAIVVTGEGKAFCAGMDLSTGGNVFGLDESQAPMLADLQERPVREAIQRGVRDTGGRVALAMYECLKPIVGAINGAAVGIGATMMLPMDFRLASEKARIGFVFGRLGITPEACSTWFLPASSACSRRSNGSIARISSTRRKRWRKGWCVRSTRRTIWSMPPAPSPARWWWTVPRSALP